MADTINDLYLKYVNSVGSTLEDDRYFRYLFEIVQAGANTLRQNHQEQESGPEQNLRHRIKPGCPQPHHRAPPAVYHQH